MDPKDECKTVVEVNGKRAKGGGKWGRGGEDGGVGGHWRRGERGKAFLEKKRMSGTIL